MTVQKVNKRAWVHVFFSFLFFTMCGAGLNAFGAPPDWEAVMAVGGCGALTHPYDEPAPKGDALLLVTGEDVEAHGGGASVRVSSRRPRSYAVTASNLGRHRSSAVLAPRGGAKAPPPPGAPKPPVTPPASPSPVYALPLLSGPDCRRGSADVDESGMEYPRRRGVEAPPRSRTVDALSSTLPLSTETAFDAHGRSRSNAVDAFSLTLHRSDGSGRPSDALTTTDADDDDLDGSRTPVVTPTSSPSPPPAEPQLHVLIPRDQLYVQSDSFYYIWGEDALTETVTIPSVGFYKWGHTLDGTEYSEKRISYHMRLLRVQFNKFFQSDMKLSFIKGAFFMMDPTGICFDRDAPVPEDLSFLNLIPRPIVIHLAKKIKANGMLDEIKRKQAGTPAICGELIDFLEVCAA